MDKKTILVTGATGYIASRLIPRLLEAGYTVRCLARRPDRIRNRAWYPKVELVAGDVTHPETLPDAMRGVSAAYYLIHSMSAGHGYARLDLESARNFAQAAKAAGVEHIIYLGGLADPKEANLALHLKSRIESGDALREAGVPVTEFRAGVIVGPGSVSFEMIRFIAEQFPLMVGPLWLRHRSQPIATSNVLDFLLAALITPEVRGKIVELGTPEVFSYIDVMARYAQIRGLKRLPLLLPFVPVRFMAFFIDLLTPVERSYAFPLVEGLQNDSLVLDRTPLDLFSDIKILDYTSAVQRALAETRPAQMERVWLDIDRDRNQVKHEGMFVDYRRIKIDAACESVFALVNRLGGENGWLFWNPVWRLRGWLDRLIGGPGLRGRGEILQEGGILDFYRVELLTNDTLRLRAELRAPGDGWMEWKVTPRGGGTLLEQTAFFAPNGLPGFLYWYLLNPFHRIVFNGLLMAIKQRAEK